jgi:hypothetical protein
VNVGSRLALVPVHACPLHGWNTCDASPVARSVRHGRRIGRDEMVIAGAVTSRTPVSVTSPEPAHDRARL